MVELLPCKHCGVVPVVSDVGGNNPYYEIGCKCENGVVVGSKIKSEAITCWNLFNDEGVESVDKTEIFFDDHPIMC